MCFMLLVKSVILQPLTMSTLLSVFIIFIIYPFLRNAGTIKKCVERQCPKWDIKLSYVLNETSLFILPCEFHTVQNFEPFKTSLLLAALPLESQNVTETPNNRCIIYCMLVILFGKHFSSPITSKIGKIVKCSKREKKTCCYSSL